MPGAVPRIVDLALTNATMPYASSWPWGWQGACFSDPR